MVERNLDDNMGYRNEEDCQCEDCVQTCYGEYGTQKECSYCPNRNDCRKFTATEKAIAKKYKGKYTGVGKFVGRNKY